MTTATTLRTPREEFTEAGQNLARCQARLDEARREFNRQRRELQVALPYAHQAAERNDRLDPLLEKVRACIGQVDEAKKLREQKYDALPDKTDADGWL